MNSTKTTVIKVLQAPTHQRFKNGNISISDETIIVGIGPSVGTGSGNPDFELGGTSESRRIHTVAQPNSMAGVIS
ncbi:MAG: hypothetical protein LW628_05540 [Fimbriimonadaceae bacterium]|nr:hypothetical protein [Fimbriimonadaceae bacterium]